MSEIKPKSIQIFLIWVSVRIWKYRRFSRIETGNKINRKRIWEIEDIWQVFWQIGKVENSNSQGLARVPSQEEDGNLFSSLLILMRKKSEKFQQKNLSTAFWHNHPLPINSCCVSNRQRHLAYVKEVMPKFLFPGFNWGSCSIVLKEPKSADKCSI